MTLDTTTATTNRAKHLLSLMEYSGADVAGLLDLAAVFDRAEPRLHTEKAVLLRLLS